MKIMIKKGIISITHKTIFFWGKKLLETPTIYIALTRRYEKKI